MIEALIMIQEALSSGDDLVILDELYDIQECLHSIDFYDRADTRDKIDAVIDAISDLITELRERN